MNPAPHKGPPSPRQLVEAPLAVSLTMVPLLKARSRKVLLAAGEVEARKKPPCPSLARAVGWTPTALAFRGPGMPCA